LYTVTPSGADGAIIVVDIKKISEQRDARPADRGEAYTPPKLRVFGPVGALTQAGGTGSMEGSMAAKPNML
jgi:hypothetical protein